MYSIADVSNKLSLHPKTVLRFIHEGKIKAKKIGREWRVHPQDLNDYLGHEESLVSDHCNESMSFARVVLKDRCSEEITRLSNSILASMNSSDPIFNKAQYKFSFSADKGEYFLEFSGGISFLKSMLELVEIFESQENS
jgi:excisionase family DNA binding protein